MSKVYTPNYTQVPNVVIDDLAAKLSDSAFKLYVVLIRKTKGWDQNRDAIAISQFMDLTGKSKPTVIKAIDELINLGLIKKTKFTKHGNEYELNLTFSHNGVFLKFKGKKSLLVKNFYTKGKEFLLLEVKNFDTQKKLSKETIKDTNINRGDVKKFNPIDCELPLNVDKKDWIDFVEMRKSIKKPLSELAAKKILKKLEGFGVHAKQAMENSIVSSWSDVYLPKKDRNRGTDNFHDQFYGVGQSPFGHNNHQGGMRDVSEGYFIEHNDDRKF